MNTHFCLIWLFKLERQGRIIRKIQISLESIPNLPRIQKIRAHRWTHRSFAFYLANGNPTLIRITWKRKDPGVSDVDSACHTLLQEARQKSVTKGWDCFPTLCWLNFFFFFWFAFYSKVMIIWTFFFFLEQAGPRTNRIWWLWVRCGRQCKPRDVSVGAERNRWCSSPRHGALSTLRGLASFLSDAGHQRTVLFSLKSAGFKALCWQ